MSVAASGWEIVSVAASGWGIVSVAASGWGIVLVAASGWGIVLVAVAVAVAAGRAFTDVRGPIAVFSSLVPVSAAACSDPEASESVDAAACSDGSSANDGCGVGRAPTSTTATTASSEGSVWSEEAVMTSGDVGLATDQVSVAAVSGRFAS